MAKKKDKGNWGKWMLGEKKKSKGGKKGGKKGPKAWGKNLYGETHHEDDDDEKKKKKLEEAEDHRGHGHDCEKVHPDESHGEWKEGEDEHDKNSASEGPHGESKGKPPWLKKDEDKGDDDEDVKEEGKGKPPWLKKDGEDDDDEEVKEEAAIPMFIKNLAEKNYAEANKYLQAAVEHKLKSRIATTAKKLGF
tara:strand:+ start:457 stop:1032 length:576 start_codon:yes stop_codon:yes gene_type:complete